MQPRREEGRPGQGEENKRKPHLRSDCTLAEGHIAAPPGQFDRQQAELERALLAGASRRWVVYEPMVLLTSGSFQSRAWQGLLAATPRAQVDALWREILGRISKRTTHLAVNEGIPLHLGSGGEEEEEDGGGRQENVMRSPHGLRMLYGDFGPAAPLLGGNDAVSEADFANAFWVATKQNGILQTWAPRWTMFSRGNVKEKARLLTFHDPAGRRGRETRLHIPGVARAHLAGAWAVDCYAGIGYFVFSYARLGMRVLCWELNPWSVEGLRRGSLLNGWDIRVVQGADLQRPTAEAVAGRERIVVFLEDNKEAARRIAELRAGDAELAILHVNCGFLPSSEASWEGARAMLGTEQAGCISTRTSGLASWKTRAREVQAVFDRWDAAAAAAGDGPTSSTWSGVKTFAPDVWHCVFDVYVTESTTW